MGDAAFVPRPTFAITVSVIWGVLLIPGLLGAALSVMFFDAPGSMNNPVAWINAGIVASFPVLCVLSIAATWLVWRLRRDYPTRGTSIVQVAVAGLPLIPVAYVVAAMFLDTLGAIASGQPMGLHSTIVHR